MLNQRNEIIDKKIKVLSFNGGVLLYAIFVTFIISILSGGIILLFYYLDINTQNFVTIRELNDEVESALQYSLSNSSDIKYSKSEAFSLYQKPYNTTIEKFSWGCFDIILTKSGYKQDSAILVSLVGSESIFTKELALNITNPSHSFEICGNVDLIGDICVPNASIKKINIEGRDLEKNNVSYTRVQKNLLVVPVINNEIFQLVQLSKQEEIIKNSVSIDFLGSQDSLYNSFTKPTICFYAPEDLSLNNKNITGNYIIISDKEINVQANCKLKDVILVAENIKISGLKNSCLQAYATGSIEVDNSYLEYPSSLVVSDNQSHKNEFNISLKDSSEVHGCIVLFAPVSIQSMIHISDGCLVNGIVYSSSYVEHKGQIYGSLFAYGLFHKTRNNYYENLLLDAEIDVTKRSDNFVGPNLFGSNQDKRVIKWLD